MDVEVEDLMHEVRKAGGARPFALRSAIAFVFYSIPAAVLSLMLMRLTEGALWVPDNWRRVILMFGFLGGMACFALARNAVRRRFRRSGSARGADLEGAAQPSATLRSALEQESKERHFAQKHFAMTRALLWLVPTVACIAAFQVVKSACVQPWQPERTTVYTLVRDSSPENPILPALLTSIVVQGAGGVQEASALIDVEAGGETELATMQATFAELEGEWTYEDKSAFLSYKDGVFRGSILLPLGFPHSDAARALLDETYRAFRSPPNKTRREVTLLHAPFELIDTVADSEALPLGLTRILFVTIHLALLLCASTAYGFSYSRAEDVAMNLFGPSA